MRFHVLFAFLVATATIFSSPAPAAVFERDFVPGSGDGLLTYDDVNQREWLDVTVFAGAWSSPDAFVEAREDPGFDFKQEFPELGSGGIYVGFTLAVSDDLLALADSAEIDTSTIDFETNDAATSQLMELLGVTLVYATGRRESIGFLDEFRSFPVEPFLFRGIAEVFHLPGQRAGVSVSPGEVGNWDTIGLMLNRQAVPEPSSVLIVMSFVLTFAGLRLSRHRSVN